MNEYTEYYLEHHGVKGMKWGVRKARKLYTKELERRRKVKKINNAVDELKRSMKPSKNVGDDMREAAERRRSFKSQDAKAGYRIAKQKAKIDPNHKNSAEYKKAKEKHTKQVVSDILRNLNKMGKTAVRAVDASGKVVDSEIRRLTAAGRAYMEESKKRG